MDIRASLLVARVEQNILSAAKHLPQSEVVALRPKHKPQGLFLHIHERDSIYGFFVVGLLPQVPDVLDVLDHRSYESARRPEAL